MIQINLLPWREQARQIKKLNFAIAIAGCAILSCFFVLICHIYFKSLIGSQQRRNDFLQAELGKEQIELTKLSHNKEQQIGDVADLNFIFSLQKNGYQTIKLFTALAKVIPDTVTFNRISREGNAIIILGKAKSNLQITTLLQNIKETAIFQQPELTEITGKEISSGEERLFQLKVLLGRE